MEHAMTMQGRVAKTPAGVGRPAHLGGPTRFVVELARSKLTVSVGADETILDALDRAGVHVGRSCRVGICGHCETQVLAGVPRHHDQIIDRVGPERLTAMMLCCSRAISPTLVLDI